jgi:hypothetical protein
MSVYLEIKMKKFLLVLSAVLALSSVSFANDKYPQGPNDDLTPGKLCDKPTEFRYPEHVAYCSRKVDTNTKKAIIITYDDKLGYQIETMPRVQFKIDHLIPLCAGGSNDEDNLWPQHQTVYAITDPMEPAVCGKMAEGKLSQAHAVELVLRGKHNLDEVPEIMKEINSL